ncbi:FBD-associated F-box protein At5g22730-like [Papaver somniferum]|nr:FBD-associated F-box protein At5g22730-like [Papaver somniferum]
MTNVSWKGLDVICFALPQLKFFTIRGFGRESIENVKVKFDTPNLLSLTWFDHLPEEFIVDSFPCLVEAGIRYNFAEGHTKSRYHSLYEFVQKVSHVNHLMVSHTYFRPKILDDSSVLPRSYHTFSNLVSFEVDVIYYGQIGLLFNIILQFSPNLASLIFHQLFWFHRLHEDVLPFNIVPQCLLLSLKSIEFRKFYGSPKEMEVVKLFLESARVLQTITLGSSSHHLEHLNKKKPTAEEVEDANDIILEQLQTFSWASADCSVKFLSP